MNQVQYRIGTVTFPEESSPTWGTRSAQILEQMASWARKGWHVSPLNVSPRIRLSPRGFRILLERPLEAWPQKDSTRGRSPRQRP